MAVAAVVAVLGSVDVLAAGAAMGSEGTEDTRVPSPTVGGSCTTGTGGDTVGATACGSGTDRSAGCIGWTAAAAAGVARVGSIAGAAVATADIVMAAAAPETGLGAGIVDVLAAGAAKGSDGTEDT